MEEKGHCKHGEFRLLLGCPQCIAEARAARESAQAPPNIIKVRYVFSSGQLSPREYTYFSVEPLSLGDVVVVPVRDSTGEAKVTAVNVPEAEIAAFRDKIKTIPAGSIMVKPAPTVVFEPEEPPKFKFESNQGPYGVQDWPAGVAPEDRVIATPDELETLMEPTAEKPAPPVETLPAPLELLNTQVDPMTVAMNPELVTACQEANRLLELAQGRTIANNADLKPAADDLAVIGKGIKLVQEIRKRILAPFKSKVDAINAAFADIIRPLEEADRINRGKVSAFDNEQRRKTAEAARIDAEKERLAREEAALKDGEITVNTAPTPAPPPVPEHTRTDLATMGGRVTWKARVLDFKALPDEYKLPNERLLNAKAASTKGTAQVPGVEFYPDRTITVRMK